MKPPDMAQCYCKVPFSSHNNGNTVYQTQVDIPVMSVFSRLSIQESRLSCLLGPMIGDSSNRDCI